MNAFTWIEAKTPEQVVSELQSERGGPAVIKAGGVDLLDRLKEGLEAPARLVNLRRCTSHNLAEITEVQKEALPEGVAKLLPSDAAGAAPPPRDCLRVGALVTLAQLTQNPLCKQYLPALVGAAGGAATPQIRQAATLGGNLMQRPRCWYFRSGEHNCLKKGGSVCLAQDGENDFHAIFDNRGCSAVHPSATAVALVALDAIVALLGPAGERYARLSALLVSPGQPGGDVKRENRVEPSEVITAVYVPTPRAGERNIYLKIKQKQSFDWPLADVAIALRTGAGKPVEAARVVLGAVAPVPWRAKAAEAALQKLTKVDEAGVRAVGQAAIEGATPLGKNGYKLPLCAGLVARAAFELLAGK
jgi:xanthine dehydrogenase YagS FAD-binding subunit